jgi:hypothetical protein
MAFFIWNIKYSIKHQNAHFLGHKIEAQKFTLEIKNLPNNFFQDKARILEKLWVYFENHLNFKGLYEGVFDI